MNNIRTATCLTKNHLYQGADGDAQPLLSRTHKTHQVLPRQRGTKGHQDHHSAAQQAGDAQHKTDSKQRMSQHTGPSHWLSNESQRTQEAELERQQKHEAHL